MLSLSLHAKHEARIAPFSILGTQHSSIFRIQQELVKAGTVMEPSPATIRIIQDKYLQKEHFAKHGIALPQYMKTDTVADVLAAGK